MRICSLEPRDGVQLLDADVDWQVAVLRSLGRGVRYEGTWHAPRVTRLRKPRKRQQEALCDLTAIAAAIDVPVLSLRAKKLLEPILGQDAQWLPLAFDEADYWLLNLVRIVDGLDLSKTKMRTLPNGKVLSIDIYAFKDEAVADLWLFKITQHPFHILATDLFRELVDAEQLTGMFFQPVWDSEHAPFRPIPNPAEIITRPEVYGPEGFVTNLKEYWPPEWKAQARKLSRKTSDLAKSR